MLASALASLLIKALTADVVAQILLRLAKYLAGRTDTMLDDEIVQILEEAIAKSKA
ncbi:hypothetical protein [Azotobacter beijerinckii]|uniref:Uncharacterized protein n=1 Tax=Azotobacter beijerinckii TaxID=170623 RepID=A0A1I4JC43_9GAMM|nr:hypothetical protein [Azotobacter beijerinckii]SFB46033.1 hypothetical protein SAMN04244571_02964 [Azotobacter beijerinckii]SFL64114.1 hypothetical protein SAMN04244574_04807 [Azotobacter beijerinckii]